MQVLCLTNGCSPGVDQADVLLGDVIARHAHEEHALGVDRGVRDDDPKMSIRRSTRQEKGVARLHGSGPEEVVEVATVRLVSFDDLDQLFLALCRQDITPGDRAYI